MPTETELLENINRCRQAVARCDNEKKIASENFNLANKNLTTALQDVERWKNGEVTLFDARPPAEDKKEPEKKLTPAERKANREKLKDMTSRVAKSKKMPGGKK